MSLRVLYVVAGALVAAACGSSTSPKGGTPASVNGIVFVAGNQQTDTVQSLLNQALVVQVNQRGAPVANQIVQFQAISLDSAQFGDQCDPVSLTSNQPASFVPDSTGANGQATVGVALGIRAGTARLIVKVPALGYVDTATFTVTAGAADSLQGGPVDTAVYVNGTVKLHAAVVDRFGNPRTDPVTYHVLTGPATLAGTTTGTVATVTGIGRVTIGAATKVFQVLSHISGVPTGTIAASIDNGGGIAVFNLDGSGYKTITNTAAGVVAWAPNGASLAFDQTTGGMSGGSAALLATTVPGGSVSTLDNSGVSIDAWPAYSRDGTWIYYVKITNSPDIWRVHPDGSGDALVSTQATTSAQWPSPSPDGTQLVYAIPVYGGGPVEIVTLATGAQTQLGTITAISTAWSPISNVIAFVGSGSIISLINSDGTGMTALTPTSYQPAIAWSPDGKWIIARNANTLKLDLVSTTTPNLILPVGFTGNVSSPSWH